MKNYSILNYIRYKKDIKQAIARIKHKPWEEYTNEEFQIKFLPLVENIARKFSTSQQASGVMSILDLMLETTIKVSKSLRGLLQARKKDKETYNDYLFKIVTNQN